MAGVARAPRACSLLLQRPNGAFRDGNVTLRQGDVLLSGGRNGVVWLADLRAGGPIPGGADSEGRLISDTDEGLIVDSDELPMTRMSEWQVDVMSE